MTNFIARHFGDTESRRTPEQLEEERFLIGHIPFPRWVLIPATFIIQLCLGSYYSWSVFNAPVALKLGVTPDAVNRTFYITVGTFGLAACWGGPWLERYGPKRIALCGSLLFHVGHLVAALACWQNMLWLLYIGYGVIVGTGLGLAYICPVSVLSKWYPERCGLAAGAAIGVFGLGSVVSSFTQDGLVKGVGPAWTFFILGVVYLVLAGGSSLLLRYPPPEDEDEASATVVALSDTEKTKVDAVESASAPIVVDEPRRRSPLVRDLMSSNFILVYVVCFLGVMPGLVMISRVKDVVKDPFKRYEDSTWVLGVNGLFNVLGRLVMGALSDRFGGVAMTTVTIVIELACIVGLLLSFHQMAFVSFCISVWCLTFGYGAILGLIPSLLVQSFGTSHIGALIGVALTSWAAGGVIAGMGFTSVIQMQRGKVAPNHIYDVSLYAMLPSTVIALILIVWFQRKQAGQPRPVVSGSVVH